MTQVSGSLGARRILGKYIWTTIEAQAVVKVRRVREIHLGRRSGLC